MGLEQQVVQQIAEDERTGNFVQAFTDARNYIYGDPRDPKALAGWSDRAKQLSSDLSSQSLLPPFSIHGLEGIAPELAATNTKEADGTVDVSLPSGYSYSLTRDHLTLKVKAPGDNDAKTYTWDSDTRAYQLDPSDPSAPYKLSYKLQNNQFDGADPSLVVIDSRSAQMTKTYVSNGDVVTTSTTILPDGSPLFVQTLKPNGLQIELQGPPKNPYSLSVTYPDYSQIKVQYDQNGSARTYMSIHDPHDNAVVMQSVPDDIFNFKANQQLPAMLTFKGDKGLSYVINNDTLSMSVTKVGVVSHYLLSGRQPQLDPTVADQQGGSSSPPDPFSPSSGNGS